MPIKKRRSNNPIGRPQSEEVTEHIHAAVFLLLKNNLYRDLSLEAIAAKAGVSRPALYRRYASVGQVILGALQAAGSSIVQMPRTTEVQKDLYLYLRSLVSSIAEDSVIGRALRGVLAAALTDSMLDRDFALFIEKRREPVRRRLLEWNNELTLAQLDAALDSMFGPILYRLLIRRVPVQNKHVTEIVDRALRSITSE